MSKKFLKINALILTAVGGAVLALSTVFVILTLLTPSAPNSWDDLGKVFAVIGIFLAYALNLPLVISGVQTLHCVRQADVAESEVNGESFETDAVKTKNASAESSSKREQSTVSGIIGIIFYSLFLYAFVYLDRLGIFTDYYNGNVNIKAKLISIGVIFLIFIWPQLVNVMLLYKEKHNLSGRDLWRRCRIPVISLAVIVSATTCYKVAKSDVFQADKEEITEDSLYSYYDFKGELEKRGFIYELPDGQLELTGSKEIFALGPDSKYGHTFNEYGTYTDSHKLSADTDRKFPLFVYDSYASLIKKSDETADYYYIGPEDWYITWYIYYVDGEIYAAIGDESEYGSGWQTSLANTDYAVVISEKEKITIYNFQKDHLARGGGITDTRSGTQRSVFPTTVDTYNKNCMKIITVDEVNAETLDRIARELSPQYWKVRKEKK